MMNIKALYDEMSRERSDRKSTSFHLSESVCKEFTAAVDEAGNEFVKAIGKKPSASRVLERLMLRFIEQWHNEKEIEL